MSQPDELSRRRIAVVCPLSGVGDVVKHWSTYSADFRLTHRAFAILNACAWTISRRSPIFHVLVLVFSPNAKRTTPRKGKDVAGRRYNLAILLSRIFK